MWLARALCAAFSRRFFIRLSPAVADSLDVKLAHHWPTSRQRASVKTDLLPVLGGRKAGVPSHSWHEIGGASMRVVRRLTRQHEYVITPKDGRLVIPREAPSSSGLWLPTWRRSPLQEIPQGSLLAVGHPPGDLDMLGAAIDPIALGLPEVDLQEIADVLDTIGFEPAMAALAAINASVWFAGADPTKHL